MKVNKFMCPACNENYLTLESSVECDCGSNCNFVAEGDSEKLDPSVAEFLNEEGTVKIVYKDGKKTVVKKKKLIKTKATSAQKAALVVARKTAHTAEADRKRRKSMSARKAAGLLGEGAEQSQEQAQVDEAKVKVVQDGEVVVKNIKTKKMRMSPKQKAALKKAQAKANTVSAKLKRAKSMKIRGRVIESIEMGSYFIANEDFEWVIEGVTVEVPADSVLYVYGSSDETLTTEIYDTNGELIDGEAVIEETLLEQFVEEGLVEYLDASEIEIEEEVKEANEMSRLSQEDIKAIAEEIVNMLDTDGEGSEEVNEIFKKVVRDGKVVKVKVPLRKKRLSAKQRAALRKARRKANTGAAKRARAKSMKIRDRKIHEEIYNVGVGCLVVEGFDIEVDGKTFAIEEGFMFDVYDVNETTVAMDIYDVEGELVHEGVEVDADFVENCFAENLLESLQDYGVLLNDEYVAEEDKDAVVEDKVEEKQEEEVKEEEQKEEEPKVEEQKEEPKEEPKVEESVSKLGFRPADGYFLVQEGKEYTLGSRVRARAYLVNEGFEIKAEQLDKARDGEEVIL